GLAAVQVDRTGDLSPTSTVWFTTSDGTALAGQDYTATRYIVTFNPGVSTQFVQVPILNDNLTDGTEDFTLTLYNPTNAELGTTYASLFWVADPVQPATIQFADSAYSAYEDDGYAYVEVTAEGDLSQNPTVQYSTGNGTATAGLDYTPATGTLGFSTNQDTQW